MGGQSYRIRSMSREASPDEYFFGLLVNLHEGWLFLGDEKEAFLFAGQVLR